MYANYNISIPIPLSILSTLNMGDFLSVSIWWFSIILYTYNNRGRTYRDTSNTHYVNSNKLINFLKSWLVDDIRAKPMSACFFVYI